MSIELPATSRDRCDMTERLLRYNWRIVEKMTISSVGKISSQHDTTTYIATEKMLFFFNEELSTHVFSSDYCPHFSIKTWALIGILSVRQFHWEYPCFHKETKTYYSSGLSLFSRDLHINCVVVFFFVCFFEKWQTTMRPCYSSPVFVYLISYLSVCQVL